MSGVDEYVAARVEHVKRQFADGDSHGQYDGNKPIKRQMEKAWAALLPEEKREAEQSYFVETWPLLRNTPR